MYDRWAVPLLVVIVFVLLLFPLLVLPRYPSVVACDRYSPNLVVDIESTRKQGKIDTWQIGKCVLYWHE